MKLLVRNGDLIAAYRSAFVGDLLAKNRLKRKLIAQMEGRFGKRFAALDGAVCIEKLYIKTDSGEFNKELMDLLGISSAPDLYNSKVHPVWLYFAPKMQKDEIGQAETEEIEARVREIVGKYGIDGIIVHWRRSGSFATDKMEPIRWEFDFDKGIVDADDADEVELLGEVMFYMHKIWTGSGCKEWENSDCETYGYCEKFCKIASYKIVMDENRIVKAVKDSIASDNNDYCNGDYYFDEECRERLDRLPAISPGLELAYHVIYKTDGTIFKRKPGTTAVGVSIDALRDMRRDEFLDFFRIHASTDYVYHKSTWDKIKQFVIGVLIVVGVVVGLYHLALAFQAAAVAYQASVAAGMSMAAAVWSGIEAFVITMAGVSTAELFGTDFVAATYAMGLVNTFNTIAMLAGIGARPEYSAPAETPAQAESSVEVEYYVDNFVDAMMPDRQIEALMAQFDI